MEGRLRAHPVISHCSHLLLKCRAATNISHWLKVHSRWFKSLSAKKCIFIPILLLLFLHILLDLCMLYLFNTVYPVPNCLQKLSADDKRHR